MRSSRVRKTNANSVWDSLVSSHSSLALPSLTSLHMAIPVAIISLLWTAPNVRQTFGDKFVDAVVEANPEAVIYDTRKHGKPDMVKLTCAFTVSLALVSLD